MKILAFVFTLVGCISMTALVCEKTGLSEFTCKEGGEYSYKCKPSDYVVTISVAGVGSETANVRVTFIDSATVKDEETGQVVTLRLLAVKPVER